MFILGKTIEIHKDPALYISFPDIIQSIYNPDRLFLIYRSGNNHHPTFSFLHFWVSQDKGETWEKTHEIPMNMVDDKRVWNCPRFSYFPDGTLNIICDSKDSTNERGAFFRTFRLRSLDDGRSFSEREDIGIYGMLPDHTVKFKDELYIANHLNDRPNRTLVQFVNFSRDGGKTWFDRNIIGRSTTVAYCEASLLNYHDEYLIAFMRNNVRGPQLMETFISEDGRYWHYNGTLPVCGHRPTVLFKERDGIRKNNRLFISYRNTKDITVSILTCLLDKKGKFKEVETFNIAKESGKINLFHFGYTGLTEYEKNKFFITYYIRKKAKNPYIKLSQVTWKEN